MQQFKHNQTHTYSNNLPKKELELKVTMVKIWGMHTMAIQQS